MIIDIPLSALPDDYDASVPRAALVRAADNLRISAHLDNHREVGTRDHGRVLRIEGVRLFPVQDGSYRAHGGVFHRDELEAGLPRRKNAVCFHGHREWMRSVFAAHPDAIIRSSRAVYEGHAHFEQTFEAARPDLRSETCGCVDGYDAAHLTALGARG